MSADRLPDISTFEYAQLVELRQQIDARLDQIRNEFMTQAATMGLACSEDGPRKRGRKPKSKSAEEAAS
ncbi:MAG: hypothetical protein AB7G08_26260 [Hyphomicrobiaceae bacterium]